MFEYCDLLLILTTGMFAYIKGKITHKEPTYAIVDVQGIGYELRISLNTFNAIEQSDQYKLHTYLHVKEDAQILFGFARMEEKKLFLNLLSISGVGPSLALMMLSSMQVEELKIAISSGDVKAVQRVKGIGSKTAQRIVLELQDRIKKEEMFSGVPDKLPGLSGNTYNTLKAEALSALTTLGVNRNVAEKSIEKAMSEWQKKNEASDLRLEDLIKLALKTT